MSLVVRPMPSSHRQRATSTRVPDFQQLSSRLGRYESVCLMQTGVAMFVIELTYKASLAEIDATMAAHVVFLKKYYAAGNFLISGRKIPRDGGIIVAVGKSRHQIEVIIREDPFHVRGLADFRVIEFRASQRASNIQERIEG